MITVEKKRIQWIRWCMVCIICLALQPWMHTKAYAASETKAVIATCMLRSARTLRVQAKVQTKADAAALPGKYCYLISMPYGSMKLGSSCRIIAKAKQTEKMTFTYQASREKMEELADCCFVIACRDGGTYKQLCKPVYITNPEILAQYSFVFPKGQSKKGLQVCESMMEDAQELNVSHSSINIAFHEMFALPGERNNTQAYAFVYKGETYWFSKSAIDRYDSMLSALQKCDSVVSAILLLAWRDDISFMVDPSVGTRGNHIYYAWNTADRKAREAFEAALTFLAKRYNGGAASPGRIVNWIVGNEVNRYNEWNYSPRPFTSMVRNYADGFRLVYNTVRRVYANARVYIPLDQYWGASVEGSIYAGRAYLDAFAAEIEKSGKIQWNLALHPYSAPLGQTDFWNNASYMVNNTVTSPMYSMKNINMVTEYVKTNFGKDVHIILSEQGYSSVHAGTDVSDTQAAAILYSYYLVEKNDMIDSFIMNRHVDHIAEEEGGCAFGLWTNNDVENASAKKPAWTTFKYMDTNAPAAKTQAKKALKVIGAKSWKKLIRDYNADIYKKISLKQGVLKEVSGWGKTKALPGRWSAYGAVSDFASAGNTLRILRSGARNDNALWGIQQSFSKREKCTAYPSLATTIRVNGSTGGAVVKIRIFAGKKIFECERAISCGQDVQLQVSLANWKYRKKISRIIIAIAPLSGNWGAGANAVITMPVKTK